MLKGEYEIKDGEYIFYDEDRKAVWKGRTIAVVFEESKGIIKHGPIEEIRPWADRERQKAIQDKRPISFSIVVSQDWDVKDLNKKINIYTKTIQERMGKLRV